MLYMSATQDAEAPEAAPAVVPAEKAVHQVLPVRAVLWERIQEVRQQDQEQQDREQQDRRW
mgnify:CR=1 FL=1